MIRALCYTHPALDPFRNMAVDEWLFAQAQRRPGMVVLRLYTWRTGAITFGCNQRLDHAVVHEALGGTPLIRRVTGGRALYHDPTELTYAVVVNAEGLPPGPLVGSVARTSAAIAEALTAFLAELGIRSQYLRSSVGGGSHPAFFHTAPCFASAARHEVVADGRKLAASAQRRMGHTLLQHGAIKPGGVAYHPALDGPVCPPERTVAPDPVWAQHLHTWSGIFFASLGRSLGVACDEAVLSEDEERVLDGWAEAVREKALERRDCIKQEAVEGGL
ncbi:MAG TPA: hypothetical protein PLR32_07850 [candidate division Zixibacteria bacterium]|nr:hypothetical protein [candidate division Zixibacteria bacterium]